MTLNTLQARLSWTDTSSTPSDRLLCFRISFPQWQVSQLHLDPQDLFLSGERHFVRLGGFCEWLRPGGSGGDLRYSVRSWFQEICHSTKKTRFSKSNFSNVNKYFCMKIAEKNEPSLKTPNLQGFCLTPNSLRERSFRKKTLDSLVGVHCNTQNPHVYKRSTIG